MYPVITSILSLGKHKGFICLGPERLGWLLGNDSFRTMDSTTGVLGPSHQLVNSRRQQQRCVGETGCQIMTGPISGATLEVVKGGCDHTHSVRIFGIWLKLVTRMRLMLLLLRVLWRQEKGLGSMRKQQGRVGDERQVHGSVEGRRRPGFSQNGSCYPIAASYPLSPNQTEGQQSGTLKFYCVLCYYWSPGIT